METAVFVILSLACVALGTFCRFLYAENRALSTIKPMLDIMSAESSSRDGNEAVLRADVSRAQAELASLREELERRMESHERVVGVLIKERDTWQSMYHNFDRAFDGTVGFYEAKIQEFQALTGKMLRGADRAEVQKRVGEVIKLREKSRKVEHVTVEKGEDGMFKQERPA